MHEIKDSGFVNKALFPAPSCSYEESDFPNKLIRLTTSKKGEKIVCLLLPFVEGREWKDFNLETEPLSPLPLLLYLHGNGEDINNSYSILSGAYNQWKVHTAFVEYPGYGLSNGMASEGGCNRAVFAAYKFFTAEMNIHPSSIIVFGRSIGTGPATELAAQLSQQNTPLGGLILQSPYLSIKSLVKSIVGTTLGSFVMNRFNNRKKIARVTSPVLLIHGKEDKLIPVNHAKILYDTVTHDEKRLVISDTAGHDYFDWQTDIFEPVSQFLEQWRALHPKQPSEQYYPVSPGFLIGETERTKKSIISSILKFSTSVTTSTLEMSAGASSTISGDNNPRVD